MAEDNLLNKVALNPFPNEAVAKANENVADLERKVKKGNKKLRRNIVKSAGFNQMFDRFLQRQAPVENELKASAQSLSEIENPYVRRQLVRNADTAIRGRRSNIAADFGNVLNARLQGQQMVQQSREGALNRAIAERDAGRNFAANEYMNDIAFQRQRQTSEEDYQRQLALAARSSRGGGGGSRSPGGFSQKDMYNIFTKTTDEGLKQLQSGMPWGEVWNSMRSQLPEEMFSNEDIDAALYKDYWSQGGAFEKYKPQQYKPEEGDDEDSVY